MPSPWPLASVKLTSCTTSFCSPGGAALAASTDRLAVGAGSGIGWYCAGRSASSFFSRCQLWRAATKPRQLAMARSTGASARAVRIDPAMMMPGVASWRITRNAPTASAADCKIMRNTRAIALRPPPTSLARCCASM